MMLSKMASVVIQLMRRIYYSGVMIKFKINGKKVFCENLYRQSLTGEMVGIKNTRELKAFGVLLNSYESQDYNALAEQWPTEHI